MISLSLPFFVQNRDGSHFDSTKVNVYKEEGSSFIGCEEIKSNDEYIHILQQDGTIQDSIFRYRWDDGDTVIGSKYFRRSWKEKGRFYCLLRFNNTGDIEYQDRFKGKHESDLRYLARYSFNPKTLD